MSERRTEIPTRTRLIGRALTASVVHAPWLWPVLRRPVQGFFDQAAEGWDQRTGAGSVDHLESLATATAKIAPAPERVLDLGTGTGEAAMFLAREFPTARVRGVDLAPEMIEIAREKVGLDPEGRLAFKVADAADLPFEDESFDLVTMVNVPPFFGEIARVLRPGGHVISVATVGSSTPFYTPPSVLSRGFRRRGIDPIDDGVAGRGTYFIARHGRG